MGLRVLCIDRYVHNTYIYIRVYTVYIHVYIYVLCVLCIYTYMSQWHIA